MPPKKQSSPGKNIMVPTAEPAFESGKTAPPFPIVGIGASAGGLEALELFLRKVPENSGMAFVIIQHLDPTHTGMLAELLQRVTKLKVFQIMDRMRVKPNCVYVIPPNKDLSILRGVLHLFEPKTPCGLRLPSIFSSTPWPMTERRGVSASSFPVWAATVPWEYEPSRKKRDWFWHRIPLRRNSTACLNAP